MSRLLSALVGASFALSALASHGSVLDTTTSPDAAAVPAFGTFHDRTSGFVFVRLPDRWVFVSKDGGTPTHPVFHDAATGFVFVQLSTGWKFVGKVESA